MKHRNHRHRLVKTESFIRMDNGSIYLYACRDCEVNLIDLHYFDSFSLPMIRVPFQTSDGDEDLIQKWYSIRLDIVSPHKEAYLILPWVFVESHSEREAYTRVKSRIPIGLRGLIEKIFPEAIPSDMIFASKLLSLRSTRKCSKDTSISRKVSNTIVLEQIHLA